MAAAFAFLGIFLTSLIVAELAALSLGDFFGANDEFVVVLAVVAAFTMLSGAVFAVGYTNLKQARALNWVAVLLALLVVAAVAAPGLVGWIANFSTNPFTVGEEEASIAFELAVPALLAILVQWGLVRRRYLQVTGEDDLTRWPWVTTVIAAFALLSPLGLTFVLASFKRTDMMWAFMASVTAGTVATLAVMAGVEYYIRGRLVRRRGPFTPPAAGLQAGAHRA
ncbi:hypothetical protein [Rhodoplanes sp. Z2-YC6860]|uniref:hypothetical protein n=1 Tax=Rhodoplanes sp. Z2-YC6860 TaxID=674703 RepID=UPI00078B20C9|nr:hypothetical protein [Rhodoplanes sp. Z2-YC6860]AMN42386.1 hypothetical protein RHPLAN_39540 [Rhodoplanes sp. Z2-YC6860]